MKKKDLFFLFFIIVFVIFLLLFLLGLLFKFLLFLFGLLFTFFRSSKTNFSEPTKINKPEIIHQKNIQTENSFTESLRLKDEARKQKLREEDRQQSPEYYEEDLKENKEPQSQRLVNPEVVQAQQELAQALQQIKNIKSGNSFKTSNPQSDPFSFSKKMEKLADNLGGVVSGVPVLPLGGTAMI